MMEITMLRKKTKTEAFLTHPDLLSRARATIFGCRACGFRPDAIASDDEFAKGVLTALKQCARSPKKMLGSFDPTSVLVLANVTGYSEIAVAVTLLRNAGEEV
jgi:hypothetical protein